MSSDSMNANAPGATDAEFRAFITDCLEQVRQAGGHCDVATGIADLVPGFLAHWRIGDRRYERPQRNRPYGSYLLYLHPDGKLCVVQDIFLPGQATGVHSHGVWGVVGVVRGLERERRFTVASRRPGAAPREVAERVHGAGAVSIVRPGDTDWHAIECVGAEPSVSLHIYGSDIGQRTRWMWEGARQRFVEFKSGYSNDSEGIPIYLPAPG